MRVEQTGKSVKMFIFKLVHINFLFVSNMAMHNRGSLELEQNDVE